MLMLSRQLRALQQQQQNCCHLRAGTLHQPRAAGDFQVQTDQEATAASTLEASHNDGSLGLLDPSWLMQRIQSTDTCMRNAVWHIGRRLTALDPVQTTLDPA